jgi:predicted AAA+ superfamily ATPase
VDRDQRPGRFLLTGSANLLTIRTVHESFAGKVEVIPPYPPGRSERLRRRAPQFLSQAFQGQLPSPPEALPGDESFQVVTMGGDPDAITRRAEARCHDGYRACIKFIVEQARATATSWNGCAERNASFADDHSTL